MGWLDLASASASDTNKTTNTQTNASGTQTPVISPQWNTAYGNVTGNVNSSGANAAQQAAIDFAKNQMTFSGQPNGTDANGQPTFANPAVAALLAGNNNLAPIKTGVDNLQSYWTGAAGTSPLTSAAPGTINSATAASGVAPYSDLYSQQLIDPSLKAFDYGTDKAFSALDARTAGAGGFANSRSGLGYSDLGTQSALQRGQLESGLKTTGLTNALGYAQGDVTRQQQADTQNVANTMGNNQFNVNAGIQQRQLSDSEITSAQQNLAQSAGITQQVANNIVTANGINVDAATALFQSGQITQQQLLAITAAAQAANGTNFQGNTGSSTNSNEIATNAKFGI